MLLVFNTVLSMYKINDIYKVTIKTFIKLHLFC